MKFSDIRGHENVKQILRNMVSTGRVPHAMLFHGPAGVGKMKMARAFAQYLACANPDAEDSCGICPACRQADSLNYPDIHYVFPVVKKQSNKTAVSDDYCEEWHKFLNDSPYMSSMEWQVAINSEKSLPSIYVAESGEIIRKLSMSAFSGKYKTMIIWQPERMNTETANKLLKVLEEPFPNTVFILVSNEPDKLLGTIISRTMRIPFTQLSEPDIASILQDEYAIDPDAAAATARLSQGSMLKALEDISHGSENEDFFSLFQNVMRSAYKRDIAELAKIADAAAGYSRDKIARLFSYFGQMFRENYVYNMQQPDLNLLTANEEAFSRNFARFVNDKNIQPLSDVIDKGHRDILRNGNAKIILFDSWLKIMSVIR